MNKSLFLLGILAYSWVHGQTPEGHRVDEVNSIYQQAIRHKDGIGTEINYEKAFVLFKQCAAFGSPQCEYGRAYMLYKGLGCVQNYELAASLFRSGSLQNRANSMYFYGLCWRNGYGVPRNEDSAVHWLKKAALLNYEQAVQELSMKLPENYIDSAKVLVNEINEAALPPHLVPNSFVRAPQHSVDVKSLTGEYKGFIIQYDWSGNHIVGSKRLRLKLSLQDRTFTGDWQEDKNENVELHGEFKDAKVYFKETFYKRTDHYSPTQGISYVFKSADLSTMQIDNKLYLSGNVSMFSPERKEPSKPIFIALIKEETPFDTNETRLRVSPNPFTNFLLIDFVLAEKRNCEVHLYSSTGELVYRNHAASLPAGHYILKITPQNLSAGAYLVKLFTGSKYNTAKVIKQ